LLESGYTVDNGAKPHEAAFYLTKREVGDPIGRGAQPLRSGSRPA